MEPPSERIVGAGSAFRAALRRGSLPHVGAVQTGAMLAVIGLVFAAVALGERIPGHGLLAGLPRLTPSEFATEALGPLAPISDDYVRQALGAAAYRGLVGESAAGAAGDVAGERPEDDGRGPATTTTTTTTAGGLRPPTLLRPAELAVTHVADRSTVRPGEILNYRITVRNVGEMAFSGELRVDSHIPFGTTDATPCDVQLDANEVPCPPLPVPGAPGDVHQVTFASNGGLDPGEALVLKVAVRVNESTQPGTRLTNHAHADAVGDAVPAVTSDAVVVTVVAGGTEPGPVQSSARSWTWGYW